MPEPSRPVLRTLQLMLVATAEDVANTAWAHPPSAAATCAAIEQTLDVLDAHAALPGDGGERAAMHALRRELRDQVALVRAREPGAVKRLTGLLHLLIEAEVRHMQREAEVD
ncbi:MAG: hypothetical protein F9K40_17715 [Kofleriaceae bacterium]|nr:MAG: hypothetical protein F9K40_17715 [Kofleriaceae bacterium]MBZ0232307.1 hypothetical protein [Kofleriaceae bacterium]